MTFQSIEAHPLTPAIGAEISGLDLTKPLSNVQVEDLHQALIKYIALFFRDQHLDCESLMRVSRCFGEIHMAPALAPFAMPGYPEVTNFHIDKDTKKIPGELWHSDMSCDPEPPLASTLYLHTVPEVGGDTAFANMYAAYDALSDRMKQHLEGLTAIHDAAASLADYVPSRNLPRSSHPVIRTHPVTKRKTIYVNENFTTRIEGISKAESNTLLSYLNRHIQEPEFQCRFRWRPHSLALWDNRAAQHSAIFDYYPQTRSGLKTQICGDKPF